MGTVTPEDFGAGRPFWCHRAYGHRTGPVNTLKPVKENAAHFIVNNSELGPSRSNPSQIWAVSYVRLQRLLNADAPAGQLLPALYAWAGERSIPRAEVDAIIKLSPRAALAELTRMVNTSFSRADKRKGPPLPPGWNRTLWKVLHRLAQRHLAVTKREVKTQGAHVRKFGVRAEAKVLVNRLIGRTP